LSSPIEHPPVAAEPPSPDGDPLARVRLRIAQAAWAAARDPANITLLAVSKGQPLEAIRGLVRQGQRVFGENYVQEALPKIAALEGLGLSWHFIGRLQANKTREVAEHFTWIHSLDRLRLAERLNAQRPDSLPPLECCIEVNLDGEASKGGVVIAAVDELVAAIQALPRLRLRGFMGMPALSEDPRQQRAAFKRLRALLTLLAPHFPTFDTLSMGTSDDFEAAIAEGSTIVRIGTAVFGPRARRGDRVG
jgi:hypothetical protein